MRKYLLPLLIISAFSLLGMKALFHPGLFSAHDIWHQVARFYHYTEAVRDGQFPPYWISNLALGFGYPLFFFSYHLPWILGLPLTFAGLDIPTIIKTLFFVSYFFSGIFMYLLAKEVFKNRWAGILSAILYLWVPYRFLTILVSAAMGTSFVFAFLPLALLGMYKIFKKQRLGIIFASLGIAGLILSHLMTTVSLFPIIFLFALWLLFQEKQKNLLLKRLSLSFLLGISASSFYLLPALFYSRLTQVGQEPFSSLYKKHFVNLSQLIYSKWGYGIINESAKEGSISFQIGVAQWLVVVGLAAILLLQFSRKYKLLTRLREVFLTKPFQKTTSLTFLLITGFWASIFLMLDASRPLWDFAANFVTLDMPTMFMLSAIFTASFASGALFIQLKKPWQALSLISLVLIALYTNRNHLRVNMYTDYPVSLYVQSETTTNSFHEYLPAWADLELLYEANTPFIIPEDLKVEHIVKTTRELSFQADIPQEMEITVRQFSFPGIKAAVDAKPVDFDKDERGRVKLQVPTGQHEIRIASEETPIIRIGKLLTLAGILGLLFARKAKFI